MKKNNEKIEMMKWFQGKYYAKNEKQIRKMKKGENDAFDQEKCEKKQYENEKKKF